MKILKNPRSRSSKHIQDNKFIVHELKEDNHCKLEDISTSIPCSRNPATTVQTAHVCIQSCINHTNVPTIRTESKCCKKLHHPIKSPANKAEGRPWAGFICIFLITERQHTLPPHFFGLHTSSASPVPLFLLPSHIL